MGNELELKLRKIAPKLRDQQVGTIFKIPEEMQETPYDFAGHTISGRHIAIEAKMVESSSLKINGSPGITKGQWIHLMEAHKACCISLIIWWCKSRGVAVITMPTAIIARRDRKSIPWKMLPEWCKLSPMTDEGLVCLIKEAVETHEERYQALARLGL